MMEQLMMRAATVPHLAIPRPALFFSFPTSRVSPRACLFHLLPPRPLTHQPCDTDRQLFHCRELTPEKGLSTWITSASYRRPHLPHLPHLVNPTGPRDRAGHPLGRPCNHRETTNRRRRLLVSPVRHRAPSCAVVRRRAPPCTCLKYYPGGPGNQPIVPLRIACSLALGRPA